jgi:hypothetical protein
MMDTKYQLVLARLSSRKQFFHHMQVLTCYLCFDSFDALLDFIDAEIGNSGHQLNNGKREALTFSGQAVTATQLKLVVECVARYPVNQHSKISRKRPESTLRIFRQIQ